MGLKLFLNFELAPSVSWTHAQVKLPLWQAHFHICVLVLCPSVYPKSVSCSSWLWLLRKVTNPEHFPRFSAPLEPLVHDRKGNQENSKDLWNFRIFSLALIYTTWQTISCTTSSVYQELLVIRKLKRYIFQQRFPTFQVLRVSSENPRKSISRAFSLFLDKVARCEQVNLNVTFLPRRESWMLILADLQHFSPIIFLIRHNLISIRKS